MNSTFAMHLARLTIVILLLPSAVWGGAWRSYDVYQPTVETGDIYCGAAGDLKYNHCATVAWYRDRWFALWNANTVPIEGEPGQAVVLSTSRDFAHWTPPIEPFNDPRYCTNPLILGQGRQWQPNLLVWGDELWCIWNQGSAGDQGCYFSRLRNPDGKWTHDKIEVGDEALIDGVRYDRLFPTQNPILLGTGRVLAPLTIRGPAMEVDQEIQDWRKRRKRDTVLFTDDGGRNWHLSPGTVIPGLEWACWEPTVWETDDGLVRMLGRNNNWGEESEGGDPATRMVTRSISRDQGATWTPYAFVPIETISSRAHVLPLTGDRFAMVMNDWRKGRFASDRQNGALFFNRGGGWDFTAGVGISGRDTRVAYPQMFVKDDAVHIAYTRQGVPSSIRYSKISPLPDPAGYYLFPRSNTPPSPVPVLEDCSLRFDAWQRLETRWVQREESSDLSLGMWVHVERGGVLLDTRAPGSGGVLFHFKAHRQGLAPTAHLSTAEHDVVSNLAVVTGAWCYLGLSIDNRAGKVHFFVDDQTDTHSFTAPAPLVGTTGYFGHKRFERSSCPALTGAIHWAGIFEGHCLSHAQHRTLRNQHARTLGKPELANSQPTPPATCELTPGKLGWLDDFVLPVDDTMRATLVDFAGRSCLRLGGEASAGVDLDRNRPAEGDIVEVEFTFRIENRLEAFDQVIVCTTGGGDSPLRVVVDAARPGVVQCRLDGRFWSVGAIETGSWSRLSLRIAGDACEVDVDGGAPMTIPFPTTCTWLYLGQGYLEDRTRSGQGLLIDLNSVRTRVLRHIRPLENPLNDGTMELLAPNHEAIR